MVDKSLKILVVEDNPVDALVIQEELAHVNNDMHFGVTVVNSLGEMKQTVENETFDMVLLDLGLDDSQGLDTLRTTRALLPLLPIVVMSGLEDEEIALQAVRESAQDYIVKDQWDRRFLVRSLLHAFEREKLAAEKDRAEQAQREIETRFRAVFEGIHDIIFIKDPYLRITHVNPAMESLFGVSASEFIGKREEDWYETEVSAQIRRWDIRTLGGETIEEEHTRSIAGEPTTFLDMRMPLRDENKGIVGVCCISRNITERKKAVPQRQVTSVDYASKAMRDLMLEARKIARTEGTVLLQGETGSGKDYLSHWIHEHSHRAGGPYFALNCAALPGELAESELFGHEAGAFTGARSKKKGMLELAEGGTLLLNEIGELPLILQSKLLTFLDTRTFLRVGGEKSVTVDARLMAASHRDLNVEVAEGRFLEPLYYRLAVFTLNVPPLRERREDIPQLAEQILESLARRMNRTHMPKLNSRDIEQLQFYDWPGNVRELTNTIERALILWDGGHLDLAISPACSPSPTSASAQKVVLSPGNLRDATDELTKSLCIEALRCSQGNRKLAAKMLGISRDALYRYMRRFKIAE